jgi:ATP-dependent RNA helicase RhlE
LKFTEFEFDPRLQEGIDTLGFEETTPVQEKAIPFVLEGRDLVATAQTGTGKTAAYLLPIIQKILTTETEHRVRAVVIVPTRELAMQIDQQLEGMSYFTPVSSVPVFGGTDGSVFSREKQALTEGSDIVICTPGRMIAHLNMGYVDFSKVEFLVLDEADRMLDMGFFDDIMKIINTIPQRRQTLLLSATMPREIRELAQKVLKDPAEVSIALAKPAEKIMQLAYSVFDSQKIPLLKYILKPVKNRIVLVFCGTKSSTKQLSRDLKMTGLSVEEIHSDLDQKSRENVMNRFRNRDVSVLVATDILSRGIDVENIDMVINFDVPHDAEDYIHRIGRTARAEASGVAITLINPKDQSRFAAIEKLIGHSVHKGALPMHLGPGPEYKGRSDRPKKFAGRGRKPRK